MQYGRKRVRVIVDLDKREPLMDVATGATPRIWRGESVQVEVLFRYLGVVLDDFSNVASMTLDVLAATRTGSVLMSQTIAGEELTACSEEAFSAGTGQHAAFVFSGTLTALDLVGQTEREFWMVVSGVTNDVPAEPVTYGGGQFVVEEDGAGSTTPPDPVVNYLTSAQSDARYAMREEADANWRWRAGGWQVWDWDLNKWRPVYCRSGALLTGDPVS